MATIPTQNAVPSEAPRDLKFNSGKVDEFVTSLEHEYKDRFGRCHMTIEGMRWIFENLMERFKVDINQAIIAAGYIPMDSFQQGAEITKRNEILRDETTGEYYRWDGDLPKSVPAGATPESSGGVGVGAWVGVGDASLRAELSKSSGSSMVGHGDITVGEKLGQIDEFSLNAGFNKIGRFLNVNKLREHKPVNIGMIVYVASAYSDNDDEHHYGGGYFQSFDNSASHTEDDGGIVIVPASGNIAWRRINFTAYDMCFWGVKPDGKTDNAEAITRATGYAKNKHVILQAPAGDIHTSEMVPVYSRTGIVGAGYIESTVFYKTTNNQFSYMNGEVVAEKVDALVGFVPDKHDILGSGMDTYCNRPVLEKCMFRRLGLNASNVKTIRPQYGLFMCKADHPLVSQVTVEGGYVGIKAYSTFSGVMEQVLANQFDGEGFVGFDCSRYVGGILHTSGTSMDIRLVQVKGYQVGFSISRLQYSTMIDCSAEVISPMGGQTDSWAFDFRDPYCISMISCATEFVKGGQIRVTGFTNPSYKPAIKISGYLPIDQQNPVSSTPIYYIDSAVSNPINVLFDSADLSRKTSLTNLTKPLVSGADAKVVIIGCAGEDWQASNGGAFVRLA